jgi:succinate dehydrogenase / fumarate reductase flavoprotein subunit
VFIQESVIEAVVEELKNIQAEDDEESVDAFKLKVQKQMSLSCSIQRTGEGLAECMKALEGLGTSLTGCKNLYKFFETRNIYELARILVTAMDHRKESRGPHLFFNEPDDLSPVPGNEEYKVYFVVSKINGRLKVERRIPVRNTEGG